MRLARRGAAVRFMGKPALRGQHETVDRPQEGMKLWEHPQGAGRGCIAAEATTTTHRRPRPVCRRGTIARIRAGGGSPTGCEGGVGAGLPAMGRWFAAVCFAGKNLTRVRDFPAPQKAASQRSLRTASRVFKGCVGTTAEIQRYSVAFIPAPEATACQYAPGLAPTPFPARSRTPVDSFHAVSAHGCRG